jgi:hypothetical protein
LTAGFRQNISKTSLSTILPEEIEAEVKEAAEISMGTEISDSDLANIKHLAEQVIAISEYRAELYDYLKNRCAYPLIGGFFFSFLFCTCAYGFVSGSRWCCSHFPAE